MFTNPYKNAFAASLYITMLVLGVSLSSKFVEGKGENLLMPIGMLSLFVLSVAVMAYLFFYQPVVLLIDGKRNEAIKYFIKTAGIFASITGLILIFSIVILK